MPAMKAASDHILGSSQTSSEINETGDEASCSRESGENSGEKLKSVVGKRSRAKLPKVRTGCFTCRFVLFYPSDAPASVSE